MRPTAYVMNMFYTGLGIARSLGEHGIPVVGLTAQRAFYGNYTRYAKAVFSPDSRHEPEAFPPSPKSKKKLSASSPAPRWRGRLFAAWMPS